MIIVLSALLLQSETAPEEGPRRATANLAQYVTNDDYPPTALRRGAQGTVGFRLVVGPDGRVADCTIAQSSGHADLDERTCEIMRTRALFEPARDASGRAVRDTVHSRITWRIHDDGPELMRFEPFLLASTISSSGDGSISCRIEMNAQESRTAAGEDCRLLLPSPDMELPSRAGAQMEFTVVIAFTPTGGSGPTPRTDYGTVVGHAEAEVTVSPEGTIADCRVTAVSDAFAEAPDYCETIGAEGGPAFEMTKDEQPRTGRVRVTAYVRVTTAT